MPATTIRVDTAHRSVSWTEFDRYAWERPALWLTMILGVIGAAGAYIGFEALFGTPSTVLFVIAVVLALRVGADLAVIAFVKLFGATNTAPHRAAATLFGRTAASLTLESRADGDDDVVVQRQSEALSVFSGLTEIVRCNRANVRDVVVVIGSEHKTLRRPVFDWRLWLRGEAFAPRLALDLHSGCEVIIAWDMRDDFELVGLREDLRALLGITGSDEAQHVTGKVVDKSSLSIPDAATENIASAPPAARIARSA